MSISVLAFALSMLLPTPTEGAPKAITAATPAQVQTAVNRSLEFLRTDAAAWRKKADCATCHHGAITAAAYSEAKGHGYAVPEDSLKEMLEWSKARFVPEFEATPHLSSGFEIPSLAMPILTMCLWTSPDAISKDEIDRMTKYTLDRQQADGGWPLQDRNPHPVFDTRDTMTTWFYLALEPAAVGDGKFASAARSGREKALMWLKGRTVADTTQAGVLRLLVSVRDAKPHRQIQPQINELLRRQKPDGGWSQTPDLGSDAYATGQALYALSMAGVSGRKPEIRKGVSFLVATQKEDGSWTMIPRVTERPASKNLLPINHFAAAWAAMGLVRSVPKPVQSLNAALN